MCDVVDKSDLANARDGLQDSAREVTPGLGAEWVCNRGTNCISFCFVLGGLPCAENWKQKQQQTNQPNSMIDRQYTLWVFVRVCRWLRWSSCCGCRSHCPMTVDSKRPFWRQVKTYGLDKGNQVQMTHQEHLKRVSSSWLGCCFCIPVWAFASVQNKNKSANMCVFLFDINSIFAHVLTHNMMCATTITPNHLFWPYQLPGRDGSTEQYKLGLSCW